MKQIKTWVHKGNVNKITDKFIEIATYNGDLFRIYRNEITDFSHKKMRDLFKLNQEINFYVTSYNKKNKRGLGSFKINHPNFMKSPFTYKLNKTENDFTNLYKFTIDDLNEKK